MWFHFFGIFLNSVTMPWVKNGLGLHSPNASRKIRSIRSPLGVRWRVSGLTQPLPRVYQDPSELFRMSSASVASWNAISLESISHYPPVNSPLSRSIWSLMLKVAAISTFWPLARELQSISVCQPTPHPSLPTSEKQGFWPWVTYAFIHFIK